MHSDAKGVRQRQHQGPGGFLEPALELGQRERVAACLLGEVALAHALAFPHRVEEHVYADRTTAFRLTKQDGAFYDVQLTAANPCCDCGDFCFNRANATTAETRVCKHIAAIRAALAALSK